MLGVLAQVKGTTRVAMTDLDGNVCIDVRPGEVLIISCVGYQSREFIYKGENIGTIQLLPL